MKTSTALTGVVRQRITKLYATVNKDLLLEAMEPVKTSTNATRVLAIALRLAATLWAAILAPARLGLLEIRTIVGAGVLATAQPIISVQPLQCAFVINAKILVKRPRVAVELCAPCPAVSLYVPVLHAAPGIQRSNVLLSTASVLLNVLPINRALTTNA